MIAAPRPIVQTRNSIVRPRHQQRECAEAERLRRHANQPRGERGADDQEETQRGRHERVSGLPPESIFQPLTEPARERGVAEHQGERRR